MKPFRMLLLVDSAIVCLGVVSYVLLFPSAPSPEPVVPVTQNSVIATPVAKPTNIAHIDSSSADRIHGDTLALRQDITRLSSELASLKRQLQTLSNTVSAMPLRVTDQALTSSMSAPDQELLEDAFSRDERLAQEAQEQRQRIDVIEADFQVEYVDSHWSASTTELIEQNLAVEELAGIAVFDVQCRSNMCRLEVQHDDPVAQMQFEAQLLMAVGEVLLGPGINPHATLESFNLIRQMIRSRRWLVRSSPARTDR